MRIVLVLLLTLATVSSSRANLEFFGGVTDPGLYPGEYPFSWPDTLFIRGPYNQATCQDSTSEYQIQTGVNSFNGATKLGWGPLDEFYRWTRLHNYKMTWYGGYAASVTDKWGDNIFSGSEWVQAFTNWVATAVRHCPKVEYINFANEPMHGGPNGAFAQAFGGAGVTGYDWIINVGKLFRKYFPHAQLGINDFQMESIANDLAYNTYGTDQTMLPQFLEMVKALKAAGVVDWVGLESYSLETVSSEHFTAALNQIGALGVKIILTEFSPDAKIDAEQSKVLSDWQRLLPVAVANQYVIGITGPWTFRKSDNGGVNGSQWIVDDTVTPAKDSVTMIWLKSYLSDTIRSGWLKSPKKVRLVGTSSVSS
jgi:endo-1,4-beta-xylanase